MKYLDSNMLYKIKHAYKYIKLLLLNFILCLSIVFCSSCEKSLDYQLENQQSKIVLYSFPMPDSILKIHLSYTTDILSQKEYEEITKAKITVQKNNETKLSYNYPEGEKWLSIDGISIDKNDSLNIGVNVNDSIIISTNTIIPEPIQILMVDTSRVMEFNDENIEEEMLQCKLSIFDPSGVANYYQIRVDSYTDKYEDGNLTRSIETIDIVEKDKVFLSRDYEASLLADIDYQSTFDDLLFNGQYYYITFLIPNSYIENSGSEEKLSLHFYLFSLSSEYYEYIRSVSEQEAFREDPFYEQSNVYSNITNGLGAVAGLAFDLDSMVIYNNFK